ncbi:MAG: hypothetical protein ACPLW7_06980, partial [Minisyncoccia bacterium]
KMELMVPNKFNKFCRKLKKEKDLNVLCKFETLNKINYFILGNGNLLMFYPNLLLQDVKENISFDFEYKQVNKYQAVFKLKENFQGFNYQVNKFFNKTIVKDLVIDLSYKKEIVFYEFIKKFDNIFNIDVLDIIYEMFEREIIFYQLDTCFMVTENNRYISNPFDSCSIKLFFTGMK